jgi:Mrp family chromosome partitioning ATPase
MSREVEVSRIIDVAQQQEDSPAAAPGNCENGEVVVPTRRELTLWTAACEAHVSWLVARGASPMIELEHVSLPDTLDSRLLILSEPGSERARSYRLLRHRLFSHGDPRIIGVTSAHPGEGKTTCALNLALAIAEDTMTRVLLLEANLRRPSLGRIFNLAPSESLIESITRLTVVGPPYPVVSISGTRLHVAVLPETPLEGGGRLDRTLFAVALSDLRDAYDYIVIDAAAVLESGDVDVVGECSSGVIVVARAGRSRKGDMRRAIAQLAPAPVLGSVLIDA